MTEVSGGNDTIKREYTGGGRVWEWETREEDDTGDLGDRVRFVKKDVEIKMMSSEDGRFRVEF